MRRASVTDAGSMIDIQMPNMARPYTEMNSAPTGRRAIAAAG
jgi:hypothetical protein